MPGLYAELHLAGKKYKGTAGTRAPSHDQIWLSDHIWRVWTPLGNINKYVKP